MKHAVIVFRKKTTYFVCYCLYKIVGIILEHSPMELSFGNFSTKNWKCSGLVNKNENCWSGSIIQLSGMDTYIRVTVVGRWGSVAQLYFRIIQTKLILGYSIKKCRLRTYSIEEEWRQNPCFAINFEIKRVASLTRDVILMTCPVWSASQFISGITS